MTVDIIGMLERMSEDGTAPTEGCSLFGVGYDDAFARLRVKYLQERFARGGSAEKFVVGPYGAGKTHFLRQLMEIAEDLDCVTAEVALNKDLDLTSSLIVYREVAKEIRPPGSTVHGLRGLLVTSLQQVRAQAPADDVVAEQLVARWVDGLDKVGFELEAFGRMVREALKASQNDDRTMFDLRCRWLEGEISGPVTKELAIAPVGRNEENIHGRRALLSLFQFVRHAKFRGTVVSFDEAEQGLAVDKKKLDRILSMLQSSINALADLKDGSALIVYAFTPEIMEKMERFAALQQRVTDPGPGQGFFDGNTLAVRIPLERRQDTVEELSAIGGRLVGLLYEHAGSKIAVERATVLKAVRKIAEDVALEDETTASRRTMVKRTCAMLVGLHDTGIIDHAAMREARDEDEV